MDDNELQQVERDIERARQSAIKAHVNDDPDEPKYYETGELSDMDDQTITPPG